MLHEGAHVALQSYGTSDSWKAAMEADCNFITQYAYDNPYREDIAESFTLYMGVRYQPDRIKKSV